MINHVMVGSNDLCRSKSFYDAVLGTLGVGEPLRHRADSGQVRLFYSHGGSLFCVSEPLDGKPASTGNGGTIGFACSSLEQVIAFHEAAISHGGRSIEEPPGLRASSLGAMNLAYVRDPDGHKLCAVHRVEPQAARNT